MKKKPSQCSVSPRINLQQFDHKGRKNTEAQESTEEHDTEAAVCWAQEAAPNRQRCKNGS